MNGGGSGGAFARKNLVRAISDYDSAVQRAVVDGKRENERAVRYAAEAVITAARRAVRFVGETETQEAAS